MFVDGKLEGKVPRPALLAPVPPLHPNDSDELPPGAAIRLVELLPVIMFPEFWLEPFAKAFAETIESRL